MKSQVFKHCGRTGGQLPVDGGGVDTDTGALVVGVVEGGGGGGVDDEVATAS
jgi:hypothetical protein